VQARTFVVSLYEDSDALAGLEWHCCVHADWVTDDRFIGSSTQYADPGGALDEAARIVRRVVEQRLHDRNAQRQ
jgi:hypothetical protein